MLQKTPAGKRARISSTLEHLHWLPVRHHVEYKLAILMQKTYPLDARDYVSSETGHDSGLSQNFPENYKQGFIVYY